MKRSAAEDVLSIFTRRLAATEVTTSAEPAHYRMH